MVFVVVFSSDFVVWGCVSSRGVFMLYYGFFVCLGFLVRVFRDLYFWWCFLVI